MITILNKSNSIFKQYLAEIRDQKIQLDSMRFRQNLERMGAIIAYEISKTLSYQPIKIQTPLGIEDETVPVDFPVITSILRAGLPIHHGMLSIFDKSPNGFITAYRNYEKDGTFNIKLEYVSCPDLTDKVLIISDAMLASGMSMELAYDLVTGKTPYDSDKVFSDVILLLTPTINPDGNQMEFQVDACQIYYTTDGTDPAGSAAAPDAANALYERFCALLRERGLPVATGVFRAHMDVELVNDGPITILLDSKKLF